MSVSGTPGTGPITLGSAAAKYQSLTGAGGADGDTVSYLIDDNATWEIGVGTYNTGVLSRDTVKASSSGGAKISVTSAATVYVTVLAQDMQSGIGANNLVRLDANSRLGVKTLTPAVSLDVNDTDAIRVPVGTTAQRPATGAAGYVRYNSTTGKFEGFGAAWGNIGGGEFYVGDTPPSNPSNGTPWWNSADGWLYLYYTDADTSQWVAAVPGGEGQYLPITGGNISGGITLGTPLPVGSGGTGLATLGSGVASALGNNANAANGIIVANGSGNISVPGTIADSVAVIRPLVSGASVASTSGSAIDFTSIPSWVKRVTVALNGVSASGNNVILVQLGTSGGLATSGYAGSNARFTGSTLAASNWGGSGIDIMQAGVAAAAMYGHVILTNISGNIWVISGTLSRYGSDYINVLAGSVTLSGALSSLRLLTTSTDVFDAGSINIFYE